MNFKKFLLLSLLLFCYSTCALSAIFDKEIHESLKCSKVFSHFEKKYQIPVDTLHSIALRESGKAHSTHKIRVVWPWSVGYKGQSHYFTDKTKAVNFAKEQLKLGETNIDIGCMQINLRSHPEAFSSVEHAFEPRNNIAYGAQFLKLKYDNLQDWHKAIAHYHSATPDLGSKYKQEVVKIADQMPEYKINLRKYISQNHNAQSTHNNINNSHIQPKNQDKNTKIASTAKISSRNYNRWRSNMMVPIPKYE